jgi:Mg-chelatase subunit ChlD
LIVLIVRTLLLAILASPFLGQLPAQTEPCLNRTIPVSVYREKGQQILGLAAENFRATVKGKQVPVVSVTYDVRPRRVVVVLDHSASMQTNGELSWEFAAAQALVAASQPQDSFAVLTFAAKVQCISQFGLDRDAVVAEIRRQIQAPGFGGTALFDAVARATNLASPARLGDSVYVISDGGDNASHLTHAEVAQAAAQRGTRICGLLLIQPLTIGRRSPELRTEGFRDLANKTGGAYLSFIADPIDARRAGVYAFDPFRLPAREREELISTSRDFAQAIDEFYRLQLQLPTPLDKPRDLKLQVVDGSGARERHVQVIYPTQVVPCESH